MLHDQEHKDFISYIEKTKRGKGFHSKRSKKNFLKALTWHRSRGKTERKVVREFWASSLDISPEMFLLLSSSYAPDTVRRIGTDDLKALLAAAGSFDGDTAILSPLVKKHGLDRTTLLVGRSVSGSVPTLREQKVVELLLEVKDMDIMSGVNPSRLSPLSDVDDQIRKIWCETTTGLPIVVPAAPCWRNRCPSFVEVWTEALKIKPKGSNA
jgi:hypothetical protein